MKQLEFCKTIREERRFVLKDIHPHVQIGEENYDVIGVIECSEKYIDVADIKLMDDLAWHKSCLESRIKNPEPYMENGEDVEKTIELLRRIISQN